MAQNYGQEMTLYFLRKCPPLLAVPFSEMEARAQAAQAMLGLRASELPLLLRKSPRLLSLPPEQLKARFDAISRSIDYTQPQVGGGGGALCSRRPRAGSGRRRGGRGRPAWQVPLSLPLRARQRWP
jgi:hypothetical protein